MQAYRYASIHIYVRQTYKQAEKQSETNMHTRVVPCVGVIQEEKGSFAILNWWQSYPYCWTLINLFASRPSSEPLESLPLSQGRICCDGRGGGFIGG